jgi:hypothetical protein
MQAPPKPRRTPWLWLGLGCGILLLLSCAGLGYLGFRAFQFGNQSTAEWEGTLDELLTAMAAGEAQQAQELLSSNGEVVGSDTLEEFAPGSYLHYLVEGYEPGSVNVTSWFLNTDRQFGTAGNSATTSAELQGTYSLSERRTGSFDAVLLREDDGSWSVYELDLDAPSLQQD